jgi:transposase
MPSLKADPIRMMSVKNRRSQATFSCITCGHEGHADHIAAQNIRSRAEAELCNPALSSARFAA